MASVCARFLAVSSLNLYRPSQVYTPCSNRACFVARCCCRASGSRFCKFHWAFLSPSKRSRPASGMESGGCVLRGEEMVGKGQTIVSGQHSLPFLPVSPRPSAKFLSVVFNVLIFDTLSFSPALDILAYSIGPPFGVTIGFVIISRDMDKILACFDPVCLRCHG